MKKALSIVFLLCLAAAPHLHAASISLQAKDAAIYDGWLPENENMLDVLVSISAYDHSDEGPAITVRCDNKAPTQFTLCIVTTTGPSAKSMPAYKRCRCKRQPAVCRRTHDDSPCHRQQRLHCCSAKNPKTAGAAGIAQNGATKERVPSKLVAL